MHVKLSQQDETHVQCESNVGDGEDQDEAVLDHTL